MTHRCAVLGSPIAHSLSPALHRAAYEHLGLTDWTFDRFDVAPDQLGDFIAHCGPEWVGLACTAPLKERLLSFGEPTELAARLASGNTFLFDHEGGRPRIDNTDVAGFRHALGWRGVTRASTAALLGAGATARSSLLALSQLGVASVVVFARDAGRAHASLDALAERFGQSLEVRGWGEVPGERVDILVSTVPAPLDAEAARRLIERAAVSFDAVYSHGPSPLDIAARAAGVQSLDGVDLLVGQGVDQVRLMTGRDCDPAPLLEACRAELAAREARLRG